MRGGTGEGWSDGWERVVEKGEGSGRGRTGGVTKIRVI